MITLVVDAQGLGYRSFHSLGGLTDGITFGFLSSILQLGERYRTNQFVFCWDAGGSKRKEVSPEYKASRDDLTPEEKDKRAILHLQFNALRKELLPMVGFMNQFFQYGYEADDLIASAVINNPYIPFVVVSADHDLFQLLQYHNCKAQCLLSKKPDMTSARFLAEYRIPARKWDIIKAIAGCPGDGVKGVAGVGESTAIKHLLDELPISGRKSQEICQSQARIYFNYKLVRLPYPDVKKGVIKPDQLSEETMFQAFSDLGFESFLADKQKQRWINFIEGEWK